MAERQQLISGGYSYSLTRVKEENLLDLHSSKVGPIYLSIHAPREATANTRGIIRCRIRWGIGGVSNEMLCDAQGGQGGAFVGEYIRASMLMENSSPAATPITVMAMGGFAPYTGLNYFTNTQITGIINSLDSVSVLIPSYARSVGAMTFVRGFGVVHGTGDLINAIATADATDLPTAVILANRIKLVYNAHIITAIGTPPIHASADTINTITSADAADLATLLVLANEELGDYNAHRILVANVHGNADTINAVSLAPCIDLPTAIALVNDIKANYEAHRLYVLTTAQAGMWNVRVELQRDDNTTIMDYTRSTGSEISDIPIPGDAVMLTIINTDFDRTVGIGRVVFRLQP